MKRIIQARTIVVKVGSATITTDEGELDAQFLISLARQLSEVRRSNRHVVLVTSGAIRTGIAALKSSGVTVRPRLSLPEKQAAAAVGQGLLMHAYQRSFARYHQPVAQVLLTRGDLDERKRFLNARNTFHTLFAMGVVPIVNENDTVAVEEIRFGDNDTLAAMVAIIADADLMILLSVVDGLFLGEINSGKPVQRVESITPAIEAAVQREVSPGGTGGMTTKLEAARQAMSAGIPTVLANGRTKDVVLRILHGEPIGTFFAPAEEVAARSNLSSRKKWIAFGRRPRGELIVNEGARKSIVENGRSLLAVGIVDVRGSFSAGDMVSVRDEQGREFARGLVNYDSQEIYKVMGLRSSQIERVLGYRDFDEVIHRDNLVKIAL